MNKPLVIGLLTAWCVLVALPAWIVYLTFRDSDPNTPILGPIIAIWVVGYLLQFGVFMAATRKASRTGIGGWFLAAGMPFVADWTVPVAPWSPLAVAAVVGVYAAWFYSRVARSDDLQRNGIRASGTVLSVDEPLMNMIINDVYLHRTMTLRVDRADGTPSYETKYSGTFMLGETPSAGDVFELLVDPNDPHHIETTDSATHARSPAQPWRPPPAEATIAVQLQQLDDLHHRGALTDEEFAAAKQRVLRG